MSRGTITVGGRTCLSYSGFNYLDIDGIPRCRPGEIRLRFFLSASRELDQLACTLDGVAARVLKGRMGKHTAGSA